MTKYTFCLFALFMSCWCFVGVGYSQSSKPNPKAEVWVKKQIERGESASLMELYPDEKDRVLSASAVEKILTGKYESEKPFVIQIRNAIVTGTLDLRKTDFAHGISMTDCRFEGPVQFSECNFPQDLILDDSLFLRAVDFQGMRAGEDVFLHQAVFEKKVNFSGMMIQGDFIASQARFLNPDLSVTLAGSEITLDVNLNQSIFEGPVKAPGLTVGGQLHADESRYLNTTGGVDFSHLFTGGLASFNQTVFESSADFSKADIRGQFQAEEAKFNHPKNLIDFNKMRVDENVILSRTVFSGPARFIEMDIGESMDLAESKFNNPRVWIDFSRISVEDAYFRECSFDGGLRMADMNCRRIDAGDDEGGCTNLLALLERAKFDFELYSRVENQFETCGYSDSASTIFIARKERERRERLTPYTLPWLVNRFLGWTAGHGRSPQRTAGLCASIVLFGAVFIFRPGRFKPSGPYGKPFRNPYWYSLDHFLPLVDLKTADQWMPKPGSGWLLHYQRFHTLLGWILIPIFLASLFGWIQ